MALLPGILQALFNLEDNSSRFERVCLELCSRAEGVQLVPTSRSWDRGRDARTVSPGGTGGEHELVLCATLSAGIDSKVEADLSRLSETTRPQRLIYCSSQELSEHAIDKIETDIRKRFPLLQS